MDKMSFNPTIGQAMKMGVTMGLTGRYTCERYYGMICAVQVELNYSQMGWKESFTPEYLADFKQQTGQDMNDTYQRTINYFQLPLLAHLRFGKEYKGVSGFIVLGPQVGFAISEKEKRGGDWASYSYSTDELRYRRPNGLIEQYDLKIENRFDYGITGGAGVEVVSPRVGHFCLEGRYYFGLSDIYNNGKTDKFGRSAHGAIVCKASYLFDLQSLKESRRQRKKSVQ